MKPIKKREFGCSAYDVLRKNGEMKERKGQYALFVAQHEKVKDHEKRGGKEKREKTFRSFKILSRTKKFRKRGEKRESISNIVNCVGRRGQTRRGQASLGSYGKGEKSLILRAGWGLVEVKNARDKFKETTGIEEKGLKTCKD